MTFSRAIALVATVLIGGVAARPAIADPVKKATPAKPGFVHVKISGEEISILPELTQALGNFQKEGIDAELVPISGYAGPDYLISEGLDTGQMDIAVHWLQHVPYGYGHRLATKALMVINEAPVTKVMVANSKKDQIRSAVDFKGLKVAEGGEYGSKSMVMHYLTYKAGLSPEPYQPVFTFTEGRLEATMKGLEDGQVDVIAFREPMASAIEKSGRVSTLYSMVSGAETAKLLGAPFVAQSVLTSDRYLKSHPDAVQHVVNAFVRTMRFVNAHSADEVFAKMPASSIRGMDRQAALDLLRTSFPSFARGNYEITPEEAKLQLDVIDHAPYDDGDEGVYRRAGRHLGLPPSTIYTNVFVDKAMRAIPK